jgi:hypothetical protein
MIIKREVASTYGILPYTIDNALDYAFAANRSGISQYTPTPWRRPQTLC